MLSYLYVVFFILAGMQHAVTMAKVNHLASKLMHFIVTGIKNFKKYTALVVTSEFYINIFSFSPLCFFIFPSALTPSTILVSTLPHWHPSVCPSLLFTARRPVFDNDISICNVLWSWLTHRWLGEIRFFSSRSGPVTNKELSEAVKLGSFLWCDIEIRWFRCCGAGHWVAGNSCL